MWDDDFTSKKFEFRQIERDQVNGNLVGKFRSLKLDEKNKQKQNLDRGRIVKTTNIDFFL